ncbi:Alpha/beta hydrolase fold-1 [Naviculisporaceae sp. PSN 640]
MTADSISKPTILIVGGGWHTPIAYNNLIQALQDAGYEVHCPEHPSMAQARPPVASLAEDSVSMRLYAQKLVDAGKRVIALMHSYGGQVGTNSLYGLGWETRSRQGLPGGVSDLVYVTAFALPKGGSMAGKVKEMGHEALMPIAFDFADDMTVNALVRWNGQCMYDPVTQTAWEEIPVTYVYTTKDMTVPFHYQTSMVALLEEHGVSVKTHTLETGHCPNLTATATLVNIINKVVG